MNLNSTRYSFLARTGKVILSAIVIALLVACTNIAPRQPTPADTSALDIATLNHALAVEHEALATYQMGIESKTLNSRVLKLMLQFQNHHKQHADLLATAVARLGGQPEIAKASYDFPVDMIKKQADVLHYIVDLEQRVASAYLGIVPLFKDRNLAKTAASILGNETMHWSILRIATQQDPIPSAFIQIAVDN